MIGFDSGSTTDHTKPKSLQPSMSAASASSSAMVGLEEGARDDHLPHRQRLRHHHRQARVENAHGAYRQVSGIRPP